LDAQRSARDLRGERHRLLSEYAEAANRYATSVREMAEFVKSGDEVLAGESRRISRVFLEEAEKFRGALYRHEANHCCDRWAGLQNISDNPPEPSTEPLHSHPRKPQPRDIAESSSHAAARGLSWPDFDSRK
jgi:hypothetical protein